MNDPFKAINGRIQQTENQLTKEELQKFKDDDERNDKLIMQEKVGKSLENQDYGTVLGVISTAPSIDCLREVVMNTAGKLKSFESPNAEPPKTYKTSVDYTALAILRKSTVKLNVSYQDYFAIRSLTDGNCLFSSVSFVLVGNSSLTQEIKYRSIQYLIENEKLLLETSTRFNFYYHCREIDQTINDVALIKAWPDTWFLYAISNSSP